MYSVVNCNAVRDAAVVFVGTCLGEKGPNAMMGKYDLMGMFIMLCLCLSTTVFYVVVAIQTPEVRRQGGSCWKRHTATQEAQRSRPLQTGVI